MATYKRKLVNIGDSDDEDKSAQSSAITEEELSEIEDLDAASSEQKVNSVIKETEEEGRESTNNSKMDNLKLPEESEEPKPTS